jgi:hypothetical protein
MLAPAASRREPRPAGMPPPRRPCTACCDRPERRSSPRSGRRWSAGSGTTSAGCGCTRKRPRPLTPASSARSHIVAHTLAWDIFELRNNRWILGYRPLCASAGATPACGSTIEVDGACSYAGSPNYVIFGVMCSLCHGHFAAIGPATRVADFTEPAMLRLIDLYKGTGPTGGQTPAANFGPSRARAGPGRAAPRSGALATTAR